MKSRHLAPLVALALLAGGGARAEPLSFQLADARGAVHSQQELRDRKAAVFLFMSPECPLSNRYVPEINRLAQEYEARGVAFFAVSADPSYSADAVRKHDEEFQLGIPTLLDPGHVLVHHTGATLTPEVAVVTPDGAVRYLGRIDDRAVDFGKTRVEPRRRDLRIALDELLAGKPVSEPLHKSIGCAIPGAQS